jgi:hypothetical protein
MEEELRQCIGGLGQQKEKKRDDNGRGGVIGGNYKTSSNDSTPATTKQTP